MRLFLFISLLFSSASYAQICDGNSLRGAFTTINCASLTIDANTDLSNEPGPILVEVTGEVRINKNVILNGGHGQSLTSDNPGGSPGPGAGMGGGYDSFGGFNTDGFDGFTSNGKTPNSSGTCGNGGSGAGMARAGEDGRVCNSPNEPKANGGQAATTEFDPITFSPFRGGFGGGAGAYSSVIEFGSGGGGGGALHIKSITGDIFIARGVTISARGGNGGSAASTGGGGGGGSGGAIWLEALIGNITNQGIIDTRGGKGGGSSSGGIGGKGSDGFIRISDISGTINQIGFINAPGANTQKLSSDISCGTLSSKEEKKNLVFQMGLGFGIALLLLNLFKTLFQCQKKS